MGGGTSSMFQEKCPDPLECVVYLNDWREDEFISGRLHNGAECKEPVVAAARVPVLAPALAFAPPRLVDASL